MDSSQWPAGLKHTRQREDVLQFLEHVDRPMTAQDIAAACSSVPLSTVYRILDAFEAFHLVEKSTLPDTDRTYYRRATGRHIHYATCLCCHRQIPLDFCPVEELKFAENTDFVITGHRLEIYGYCRECLAKQRQGRRNMVK